MDSDEFDELLDGSTLNSSAARFIRDTCGVHVITLFSDAGDPFSQICTCGIGVNHDTAGIATDFSEDDT